MAGHAWPADGTPAVATTAASNTSPRGKPRPPRVDVRSLHHEPPAGRLTPEHFGGQYGPPDLADRTKYVVIRAVPILDTHDHPTKGRITTTVLRLLAKNTNRRCRKGDYRKLILGHCKPHADEHEQPRIVGWSRNYKVNRFRGRPCLYADFYIKKAFQALIPEFPFRSVERMENAQRASHNYIDAVALLRQAPERELGILTYARGDAAPAPPQATRGLARGDRLVYYVREFRPEGDMALSEDHKKCFATIGKAAAAISAAVAKVMESDGEEQIDSGMIGAADEHGMDGEELDDMLGDDENVAEDEENVEEDVDDLEEDEADEDSDIASLEGDVEEEGADAAAEPAAEDDEESYDDDEEEGDGMESYEDEDDESETYEDEDEAETYENDEEPEAYRRRRTPARMGKGAGDDKLDKEHRVIMDKNKKKTMAAGGAFPAAGNGTVPTPAGSKHKKGTPPPKKATARKHYALDAESGEEQVDVNKLVDTIETQGRQIKALMKQNTDLANQLTTMKTYSANEKVDMGRTKVLYGLRTEGYDIDVETKVQKYSGRPDEDFKDYVDDVRKNYAKVDNLETEQFLLPLGGPPKAKEAPTAPEQPKRLNPQEASSLVHYAKRHAPGADLGDPDVYQQVMADWKNSQQKAS